MSSVSSKEISEMDSGEETKREKFLGFINWVNEDNEKGVGLVKLGALKGLRERLGDGYGEGLTMAPILG